MAEFVLDMYDLLGYVDALWYSKPFVVVSDALFEGRNRKIERSIKLGGKKS